MREKLILVSKEGLHKMRIDAIKEFVEGIKYAHDRLVEYELEVI